MGEKWNYVCLFIGLFKREIIGHSAGANKTAKLVYKALPSIARPFHLIEMFHPNCGSEFKNQLVDDALETFGIERSLSMKGRPYDNAVAEAMSKVFKKKFSNGSHFNSLDQLEIELNDYVN